MHRRALLRTGVAGLTGIGVGFQSAAAASQESYEPIGKQIVTGAREAVVDGTDAYVATRNGEIQDLWLDGDRLVAAGPAESRGNSLSGAVLFDVSDPSDPVLLDEHETSFLIHNTSFDDGVVSLTGTGLPNRPVVLLSTDGGELAELARWSLVDHDNSWRQVDPRLHDLHDVIVADGRAYLSYWDAGTWILDVSNPAAPRHLGHFGGAGPAALADVEVRSPFPALLGPPGNHHTGAVGDDGSLFALGKESWAVETGAGQQTGGPSGVELWDVSDPADPTRLSTIEPPESSDNTYSSSRFTTAHNIDIAGDRLYTSWYYGGVKLHDINDPTAPDELAWWRAPDEATFWTAQAVPGRDFFVASSTDYGTNRGAVYTFPDRPGEQTNPPSLLAGASAGGTGTNGQSSRTNEEGTGEGGGDSNGLPGFGIGATAGCLGLGALRLLRDQRESSSGDWIR
jgi:hypothetical protein